MEIILATSSTLMKRHSECNSLRRNRLEFIVKLYRFEKYFVHNIKAMEYILVHLKYLIVRMSIAVFKYRDLESKKSTCYLPCPF
jgi:hypothetical protein